MGVGVCVLHFLMLWELQFPWGEQGVVNGNVFSISSVLGYDTFSKQL